MVWPSMLWASKPPLPSGLLDEPMAWLGQGARMTAYASGDGRGMLDQLLLFIEGVWRKGITEDTFHVQRNYGWIGSDLMQIDVCELHRGHRHVRLHRKHRAILNPRLLHWLTSLEPSLAEYLTRAVLARWG